SPGKPNFNILKMAREGIGFELRNALLRAKEEKEVVVKENIIVKNQDYLATIEIIPLHNADDNLLVIFRKCLLPELDKTGKAEKKNADQLRIKELENELAQMREDIKRVTEEQQTAFEELQTTNEELLSSSEELQALNEELETATEEMQSNNEELMCVNDELMDRQAQLIVLRDYSESIVNTIREPLVILDKDLRIKSVNPSFYKYFRTTEQETEGRSLFEIGHGHWDLPEFRALLGKVISEKTTIEDFKLEIFFPGLGKRVMVINARRIVDVQPSEYILMAVDDITQVVEANEMLTSKNAELEFFNGQLDSFSTAASHDLQEPLRKIHMFSKMILDDENNISNSGKHHMERIIVSIENMRQLIDDLIGYTRINIPEKVYKKSDVNQLLKKTVVDLKDIISEKNATVEVLPMPQVKVMASQFQQLFTNLIVNAIKYSKDNVAPVIRIESVVPDASEIEALGGRADINYIKIMVKDNGLGFSNDNAEKIFDPFFRLHSKDKYRGTGLGLTLCRKIVSNHDGFIRAESKVNVGTVMSIYLPL
ncbi:MAG TPA: ATP-binding protein, partial [Flavobacterium sp.]|nr:ATP-binding protein [Flavobacterium sp.]